MRPVHHKDVPMQRHVASPWAWASPSEPEPTYAAVILNGGGTYAGPADGILPFAPALTEGATMRVCPRAEALRMALRGVIE